MRSRLTAWALLFAAELALAGGAAQAARRYGGEAAALFTEVDCRIGSSRTVALVAQAG